MEIKKEYVPFIRDIFRAFPQTVFIKDTEGKYVFTTKVCDLLNAGPSGTIVGKQIMRFSLIKNWECAITKKIWKSSELEFPLIRQIFFV